MYIIVPLGKSTCLEEKNQGFSKYLLYFESCAGWLYDGYPMMHVNFDISIEAYWKLENNSSPSYKIWLNLFCSRRKKKMDWTKNAKKVSSL